MCGATSKTRGPDRLTKELQRKTGKRPRVALHTLDYRTVVGIGSVKIGETFGRGYEGGVQRGRG
jgi:hypothetical protein